MPQLQAYRWAGTGYKPLVFSDGWQAALLNWEPLFAPANLGEIERHVETDEVFVLWRGRGALFVSTPTGVDLTEMEPGVIYNVPRGAWHNLLATPDASWLIVENKDTHLHDTETRQLTGAERTQILAQLPDWLA